MEYVGFTIVIAASGAIIIWTWKKFMSVDKTHGVGSSRQLQDGAPAQPIPPFKRTISGPRQDELEREEFENRLDAWQRKIYYHGSENRPSVNSASGTKYTFVPGKRQSPMQADTGL